MRSRYVASPIKLDGGRKSSFIQRFRRKEIFYSSNWQGELICYLLSICIELNEEEIKYNKIFKRNHDFL